jgi:hypothetical protein
MHKTHTYIEKATLKNFRIANVIFTLVPNTVTRELCIN